MPDTARRTCPDGGTCHHGCAASECFRVTHAGPLSGVFPLDRWPDSTRAAYGADNASTADPLPGQVVRAPLCGTCRREVTCGDEGEGLCPTCRVVWEDYNTEDSPARRLSKAEWAEWYGEAQVAP